MTIVRRLLVATLVTTFLLVGVGAMVRAAGAGLGCPDWPLCFGKLIPPSEVSEIPADAADRERWVQLFNPTLAYIEYANRLFGIFTGLLMIVTVVFAWRRARHHGTVMRDLWWALGLTVLQGPLGALVVFQELEATIVTVHLVVAIAILLLLANATASAFSPERPRFRLRRRPDLWVFLLLLALGAQIIYGAEAVRGEIDTRAKAATERLEERVAARLEKAGEAPGESSGSLSASEERASRQELEEIEKSRAEWLAEIPEQDIPHRQIGAVLFVCTLFVGFRVLRDPTAREGRVRRAAAVLLGVATLQIATGLALAYLDFPPAAMVLHLLFATAYVVFGYLLLRALSLPSTRAAAVETKEPKAAI